MTIISRLFLILLATGSLALAQQSEPRKSRSPRLTTEDVIRPASGRSVESQPASTDANKVGSGAKSSASVTGGGKQGSSGKPTGETVSADELAWRDRLTRARQRAQDQERAAEEAENYTTELRNQLTKPVQTTSERNATAAELERAGKQVSELQAQAREAKAELTAVLADGTAKGYRETPSPTSTTADGKPNESYYRQRYQQLTQALRDAERRITLYENRVRSLNESINSSTRDRFSSAQLEQSRNDAQENLDAARAAHKRAQEDIAKLMEEAQRAGVAPGIFR